MKRFLVLFVAFVSLSAFAQSDATSSTSVKFGYLSYQAAIKSMPDYTLAQQKLTDLKEQYKAETKRVEDEFNRKYEEFLDGQRDFPKSILQKRQSELQELMQQNILFKNMSTKELEAAEKEAMNALKTRLNETLSAIAQQRGLALIVNTDSDACPFINPALGEDINEIVKDALK